MPLKAFARVVLRMGQSVSGSVGLLANRRAGHKQLVLEADIYRGQIQLAELVLSFSKNVRAPAIQVCFDCLPNLSARARTAGERSADPLDLHVVVSKLRKDAA